MKCRGFAFLLVSSIYLAGCGGGSESGPVAVSGSGIASASGATTGDSTTGSMLITVTNPALPPGTVKLSYTVADGAGNQMASQTTSYSSGTPSVQLVTGAPTSTDTVTVQALDANNTVLLQGQGIAFVPVGGSGAVSVTLGDENAISLIQFYNQPTNVVVGATEPTLVVELVTARNFLAVGSTATVTLAIAANPGAATAGGTLTVMPSQGFASFTGVTVDQLGTGYTLVASSAGAANVTSSMFNVVNAAGIPTQLAFTFSRCPPPLSIRLWCQRRRLL